MLFSYLFSYFCIWFAVCYYFSNFHLINACVRAFLCVCARFFVIFMQSGFSIYCLKFNGACPTVGRSILF